MRILILSIILVLVNKTIFSKDLFNSSFYKLDFVSNNIEDDKLKQISKIKQDSFLNILQNTLNIENYKNIENDLTDDLINTFVKNIVINDEKIINDKYSSSIKINFNKNKIINYFRDKNLSYIEFYPDKILLIIYEEDKINDNLFSKNNNYYKYFNEFLSNNYLFKIPNLDINDRYILKKEHLINKDLKKINNFSEKYNLDDAIIVIAKKNENKVNYNLILFSDNKIYEKEIQFNKHKFEEFFKILEIETLDLWKKINEIQNIKLNYLNCKIKYYNLLELKEIRSKLNKVSIIKEFNVKSIFYRNIEYEFLFYGNMKKLYKIFQYYELQINNLEEKCTIRLK
tara:strand:+ start:3221 stop:4246 length:1026 start_codon:yes stop_codon:yes gene_type:complete